jgi:hypothetical protein
MRRGQVGRDPPGAREPEEKADRDAQHDYWPAGGSTAWLARATAIIPVQAASSRPVASVTEALEKHLGVHRRDTLPEIRPPQHRAGLRILPDRRMGPGETMELLDPPYRGRPGRIAHNPAAAERWLVS